LERIGGAAQFTKYSVRSSRPPAEMRTRFGSLAEQRQVPRTAIARVAVTAAVLITSGERGEPRRIERGPRLASKSLPHPVDPWDRN
jgi:hypothetical protein